jgi:hypothetical protein
MESWAIFKHAVWMVFANFRDALRVTGMLYLAMFVCQIILIGEFIFDPNAMQIAVQSGTFPWDQFALYMVLVTVGSMWAAIGWHRFVLLEESPRLLPRFLPGPMLTYLGKTMQMTLVVILASVVIFAILGLVVLAIVYIVSFSNPSIVAMMMASSVGMLAGFIPVIMLWLRLAVLLPAAALGLPMTMGQALGKTRGRNPMLLVLAVIMLFVFAIAMLPGRYFVDAPTMNIAFTFFIGWFQLIVAASLVTTLYGVYVEGRDLP